MEEIVNRWLIYGKEVKRAVTGRMPRRDDLNRCRKPRFFFEFGEEAMTRKHLERLMKEGRVKEKDNRFVRV